MALQPALTWTTLLANYSAAAWTPLLRLARTTYAQQGQLLTAAQYLALVPSAAAAPFVGSAAAAGLLAAALPAPTGEAATTYADYAARGTAQTQPVLRALGAALTAQGIGPAALEAALAGQNAAGYLAEVLTPEGWAIITQAAQTDAQYRLDGAGRTASLFADAPALAPAFGRARAALPGVSLEALVALPVNEVARALWMPAPAASDPLITQLVGALQAAAQRVIAENYPLAEQTERLLAFLDPDLRTAMQGLITQVDSTEPHIMELAQAVPSQVADYLAALPANHSVVYGLAAALQAAGQRFLQTPALAVAPSAVPGSLGFGVQLLGVGDAPLAGFVLDLIRGQQSLGTLTTDAEGRVGLRVARSLYLADDDTVAEAQVQVEASVFGPGQPTAGEPLLRLVLTPTTEGEQTLFTTGLAPADLNAPPASAPLAAVLEELPADLREVLAAHGLTTLADVRAAGGLQSLFPDLLAQPDGGDGATLAAARRLDGLARFEVVSADAAFNSQVLAAGFYSPDQLLSTASPDEFVERLGLAQAPAEQREQAQVFYQQVAATQSLSQALGLLMAGAQASGTVPGNAPANAPVNGLASAATAFDPDANPDTDTDASLSADPDASLDPDASPDNGASAQRQIPGLPVTPAFNPAPNVKGFNYDSSQQCDCPACRSAVSPTAYLASLLSYATTNLRGPGQVTRAALQAKFYQPFADLRVSCQAAEEPVCQYRLAIEVLHAYAKDIGKNPLSIDQTRPYLEAMLEALLQALGTSLAELRTAPAAQLPALATRLALSEATLAQLRTEFASAKLVGTNALASLEARLEEFFGLASTSRDPLSNGLVLTDKVGSLVLSNNTGPVRLKRWSLQGLQWGLNTSPDGSLLVEIISDTKAVAGRSPALAVVVYKTSLLASEEAKVEDNVVARGDLHRLDANDPAQGYAALLYPQHGSELSGSMQVMLDSLADSTTTFRITAMPAVAASQQQVLHAGWLRQDAAPLDLLNAYDAASWNGYRFLIDPDLLGPDDFRPGATRGAYAIWRRRYEFLQTELPTLLLPAGTALSSSNLAQFIAELTTRTFSYTTAGNSTTLFKLWGKAANFSSQTGTDLLAGLHAALASGPAPTALLAALGLSAEEAQRLYDLWQLNLAKPLGDNDVQEVLDLVRRSAKKILEEVWVSEEATAGLPGLSLDDFQPALHEPQPGVWDVVRPPAFGLAAAQQPRLDPDEVTPLDLPDTGLGDVAATRWGARQAELLRKRQALVASGAAAATPAARAAAMLAYAYRPDPATPTTGLPGRPPVTTLDLLGTAYQNDADPQHAAAQQYVAETLALRPTEFERLLALTALATTQPTDGLWQELAAVLTLGWKRAVAYRLAYVAEGSTAAGRSWLAQEQRDWAGPALDYLIGTRKHRLLKWRATPEARAAWTLALAQLAERPLIDPDQLVAGDFRQAGERSRVVYTPAPKEPAFFNPAYDVFAGRDGQVRLWLAEVQAAWPKAPDKWAYVAGLLGSTPAELQELARQLALNVDVRAALRRLGLPAAGLTLLAAQIADPAATDRLPEVCHLLVQVRRSRAYAAWAREERALGLGISPQFFRRPAAVAEAPALLPWRSSATARRQWQRTLSARYAQAEALAAAHQQAVRSAEDQYLPLLREALITYQVATQAGFDSKADWLNSSFLLDFKTTCCQHTTRVAQSMEVLQKLFGNLRGGLASNGLTLANSLTTFDTDWQWLGSYERWRSLLFLYLYPQNVLLPALKPGQSSQYRQTVSDIRQAATLSPAAARDYMLAYQDYLADMSTLQIGAATETTLASVSADGFQAASGPVNISVQTALSASHAAYANIFNLTNPAATTNYNWTRLPGAALVEQVIGSTVYQPQDGERYVYVFALLREDKKSTLAATVPVYLAFQRLNLRSLQWEADYTQLDIQNVETLDRTSLRVIQNSAETWAPVVVGLRNRRDLLYTDYPFSQPVYAPYNVADTGSQLALTRVLATKGTQQNVDLFFVALDAAGKGIGLEQNRTIFCCLRAKLLSGIQATRNTLTVCLSLAVGMDVMDNSTLNIFRVRLADYGSQVRYLIPGDFYKAEALAPVRGMNPITFVPWVGIFSPLPSRYYTSLFATPEVDPFGIRRYLEPILKNIKAFLDGSDEASRTKKVVIDARAETMYAGAYLSPTAPTRVGLYPDYINAVAGVRITPHEPVNSAGELKTFTYETYYSERIDLNGYIINEGYCASFYVTDGGNTYLSRQPGPYIGTPSVVTLQPKIFNYIGPALHSASTASGPLGTTSAYAAALVQAEATKQTGTLTAGGTTYLLSKVLPSLPPLFSSLSAADQKSRRDALAAIHAATPLNVPSFVNTLVSEAYYGLPVLLAQELVRSRNYELALHYFRLVYDYTQLAAPATAPDPKRLVYPALLTSGLASYAQDKVMAWLQDPSNPHTLAALRPDSHLQYVVMSVARCLLAYADTEFTTDTAESVSRARSLYELAARLLKQDITQYAVADTASLLDPLDAFVPAAWLPEWLALKDVLARVNQRSVLDYVLRQASLNDFKGNAGPGLAWLFAQAQAGHIPWDATLDRAWLLVDGQLANLPLGYVTLGAGQDQAPPTGASVPVLTTGTVRPYVPFYFANFCVPTNPVPFALALQAELNLFKIRSCRNIAGIQRELEPYAAATDNTTGLPSLNGRGQLTRSARLVVPATQYRYAFIIERARQLVALAQQTEGTLLSALEKRDAEAYNQLKARQDIAVSQATVQLQTLRVTEAEDGVDLAGLQLEKSEITEQQYAEWLDGGLSDWETAQLAAIAIAGAAKATAAIAGTTDFLKELATFGGKAVESAANAVAALAEATAQIAGLQASYERRANEWNFQHTLAKKDIQINKQQIKIANDQVRITGQEKRISQLQLDHSQAVLDFLTTKFTNAELYDWMSRILETAYGYFLQQATATARLAEQQLAFERQQVPAGVVQADYYSDPADDATTAGLTTGSTSTSRKGLTGSVRLLQDLTRLDEYAFETNRRKLQLSKTISLAQSFPTEFVRFRETGLVSFACQPEWFDQDFPGQYLRIVRRVRTSVIALVPPVEGIKARLSTAGTSHVTVDGTPFQTLALPRAQEAVALTSPLNATGLYELDTQNELLLPFEGLGVDVPWQFAMQPASNPGLDYSAVADVLITLDYSALESADYARQVVQQLGTDRRQVVALSLRDRFADQWYDLHHADELDAADQYQARLVLTADDLPRHLRQATVSQVSLYVEAPLDDATDPAAPSPAFTDRSHLELRLSRGASVGGTAFTNQYGLISTRTGTGAGPLYTGNAAALLPLLGTTPAGEWVLSIAPGRLRERLAAGLVTDIYLLLEVEGTAPAYVL